MPTRVKIEGFRELDAAITELKKLGMSSKEIASVLSGKHRAAKKA